MYTLNNPEEKKSASSPEKKARTFSLSLKNERTNRNSLGLYKEFQKEINLSKQELKEDSIESPPPPRGHSQ